VVEKFRDNAARALPPPAVTRVEEAAQGLDALADVGSLMRLTRA